MGIFSVYTGIQGLAVAKFDDYITGMFSGIVEHVGQVTALQSMEGGVRLQIGLGPLAVDAAIGDSISVSGACLTIAALSGDKADFDVSAETLRKTTLQQWRRGRAVNLERALAVGDRIGGHFVGGHVDGVGRLAERVREGNAERFTFALPEDGSVRAVEKGSLAVDGVSLTTWKCQGARCSIAVIPHTLAKTTLASLRPGDLVNLEQDMIGRWVLAGLP
jgi:riboflavin synthase